MDTNQLQAFDQIVRLGSFSKAARKLDISQPAISVRIQILEQAVGGALFRRGGSRLELTELGSSFLPYARQALAVLATGVENARLTTRGERGRVVVGTLPSLATGFFAATLARLYLTHPGVTLAVHTGHNQQIVDMLHDGFIKLGFMTWPFFSPGLVPLLHIREPLIAIAHANHPLARRDNLTIAELGEEAKPFFQIDWSVETRRWQEQWGTTSEPEFEVPPQTAYDLIMRGIGVALMTRSMVEADLDAGRLVELSVNDLPTLLRESALVRLHRTEDLPMAAQEFIRIFQEEARLYL